MAHKKKVVAIDRSHSTITDKPIWRFDLIDREGAFAFDLARSDFSHKEILQKLMDYGEMTWAEIDRQQHDKGKSKHHYLDYSSLSAAAIRRIQERHFEEQVDAIYSFALRNMLRIIGFRQGAEFHVVWYDCRHEFCPSKK